MFCLFIIEMLFIISKLQKLRRQKKGGDNFWKMIATINLWFSLLIVVLITKDN